MINQRVMLLGKHAEKYLKTGKKLIAGGFWNSMIKSIFSSNSRHMVFGFQGDANQASQLIDEGFELICKIDERFFHLKKDTDTCIVAITEDGLLWDLSDWGTNYMFITRFLAEVYFMLARDDFRIDQDEKEVFVALVGCLEATKQEITDARNIVYWTLVEKVLEDGIVTEEELETLKRIRDELEIARQDVTELHAKGLKDYYDFLKEQNNGFISNAKDLKKITDIAQLLKIPFEHMPK